MLATEARLDWHCCRPMPLAVCRLHRRPSRRVTVESSEKAVRSAILILEDVADYRSLLQSGFKHTQPEAVRCFPCANRASRKRADADERFFVCGITFELSRHQRCDARARSAKMYNVPPTGPARPTVGAGLTRTLGRTINRQSPLALLNSESASMTVDPYLRRRRQSRTGI